VANMVDAARMQLTSIGIGDVFARAIGHEVTFIAPVEETLCRCRADALSVEKLAGQPLLVAYDYKTTAQIPTDTDVPRLLANMAYDIQDAHYTATIAAATGLPCEMRFVVQEKTPPHLLTVVRLSLTWREDGQQKAARAREIWSRCLATNTWPGLSGDMIEVDAPPWHATEWSHKRVAIDDARQRFGHDILARAFQFQAPAPTAPALPEDSQ
uniref:PD-(D/E)XK nuclease-like domain-containing protein n=1 Tax=Roseovarius halophilus (ex Wu et al. 2025) TaxID=3376060 RepID=UPI00399BAE57